MRRLLSFVLKLVFLLALVIWLADSPGTARLVWHGYIIETSAAFLGLLVLAAGFVFYGLWRLARFITHGPEMWRLRRRMEKLKTGQKQLTSGLIAVASGNAPEAGRLAVSARKLLGVTPVTQLLQAQAAQLAGDSAMAHEIFTELSEDSASAVLGYRGLIMEAMRASRWDEAAALAEKLRKVQPKTPWLNLIRFELATRRQQWDEADAALDGVLAARLIEPARARQSQAALMLATAQNEARQGHREKALQLAEQAAREAPKWLPALIALAERQMEAGHARAAHRTIERSWAESPHPQLARAYRKGREMDPMEAYKQTTRLCRSGKDGAEDRALSRLVMAEAALEADIWGEARRHLITLTSRGEATQSAYRLLARLERRESGNEQAALQWLTRAVDAPPDPVWLCRACGGGHEEWQAVCADCGSFNTLEWQTPGKSRPGAATVQMLTGNWAD